VVVKEEADMRVHRELTAALAAVLVVAVVAGAQTPTKQPEVPYVPTHEKIVAEMLKVANVKKGDVLYDLGSGDGRIVITAAKQFGTRGVGIDIDPERIKEANENARKAGVTDRTTFILGDIFEADFRQATVVTMYLLQEVNMRLRPKLLRDLRPGTRIVSHNYDLGDWKPQRTIKMAMPDGDHWVYFWVVPPRTTEKR